jgi:hypothetical protein
VHLAAARWLAVRIGLRLSGLRAPTGLAGVTTPSEAAAFLVVEARCALGRLRTAWPWLAEARIPGPEMPTVSVPDRREHVMEARAETYWHDRNAKFEALRAGRKPSGHRAAAARVGVTDARRTIPDQVARLAARLWEYVHPGRDIEWPVLDYRTVALSGPCTDCKGTGWRPAPPWWRRTTPPSCPSCGGEGHVTRTHATDPTDQLMALSLALITDLLPSVRHPEAAADALRVLDRADRTARKAANAAEHRIHIHAPCPVCGNRDLWAETSSPRTEEWTVRCESHMCVCRGPGCSCGRPVRWRGRRHLWPSEEWGIPGGLADRLDGSLPDLPDYAP